MFSSGVVIIRGNIMWLLVIARWLVILVIHIVIVNIRILDWGIIATSLSEFEVEPKLNPSEMIGTYGVLSNLASSSMKGNTIVVSVD